MFKCPLCCSEYLESKAALIDHLRDLSKTLRCPICDIRFDNLMVMTKHLERGCKCNKSTELSTDEGTCSDTVRAKESVNKSLPNKIQEAVVRGIKSDDLNQLEEYEEANADSSHLAVMADADIVDAHELEIRYMEARLGESMETEDQSDTANYEESHTEVIECTRNIKEDAVSEEEPIAEEIISEDQYLDKNGQLYRRRVIKIENIWSDGEKDTPKETEAIDDTKIRKPVNCSICNKRVKSGHALRLHLEVAHRTETKACLYCSRVFASAELLQEHMVKRHSRPFACVYCNRPFRTLTAAKNHVESHKFEKKKKYSCELCDFTEDTYLVIKQHYRQKHQEELKAKDAPDLICPFKSKSNWYEYHGHSYRQVKIAESGSIVLRCWVVGCWASCRIPVIGHVTCSGEHTHPPYAWVRQRNELYTALRNRCASETTPIRIIYDEECFRLPLGAKHLSFPQSSMRKWKRDAKEMAALAQQI